MNKFYIFLPLFLFVSCPSIDKPPISEQNLTAQRLIADETFDILSSREYRNEVLNDFVADLTLLVLENPELILDNASDLWTSYESVFNLVQLVLANSQSFEDFVNSSDYDKVRGIQVGVLRYIVYKFND